MFGKSIDWRRAYEQFPALSYFEGNTTKYAFSYKYWLKHIISYSITLQFSKMILKEQEPNCSVSLILM